MSHCIGAMPQLVHGTMRSDEMARCVDREAE